MEGFYKVETSADIPKDSCFLHYLIDVSATNILGGIYSQTKSGLIVPVLTAKFKGREISDFQEQVLGSLSREAGISYRDIKSAVLSPAGSISKDRRKCRLTNADFYVDADEIEDFTGVETGLVNDYEAISWSVAGHKLGKLELKFVSVPHTDGGFGSIARYGRFAVFGAGTGLGVAKADYNKDYPYEFRIFDCEGGHTSLGVHLKDKEETELLFLLSEKFHRGRVLHHEAVFSGPGISNMYECLLEMNGLMPELAEFRDLRKDDATGKSTAYVAKLAKENPDSLAGKTFKYFFRFGGRRARNLIFEWKPYGGIHVFGGAFMRDFETLPGSGEIDMRFMDEFVNAMDNDGPTHENLVKQFPVFGCQDFYAGVKGCGFVAGNEALFNEKRNRLVLNLKNFPD